MSNCNDDLICGGENCLRGCEDGGFTVFGTGRLASPPSEADDAYSFYSLRGGNVMSGDLIPLVFASGAELLATANAVTPNVPSIVRYCFQCSAENNIRSVRIMPEYNGVASTAGFASVRVPSGALSEATGVFPLTEDTTLSFRASTDEGVTLSDVAFDLLITPLSG